MQISSSIENNRTFFQKKLRPDISFDVVDRNLMIGGRDACLYCIDGFTKDDTLLKVLQAMSSIETAQMPDNANDFAALYLAYGEIGLETDSDALIIQLLSGVPFLLIDGYAQALTIDCRTYPARGVSEPEKDKVLRGSRDGFVETLVFNTALIRRRIRDPKLRMEIMNIGESSHTDIAICYMENRVDTELLNRIRTRKSACRCPLDEPGKPCRMYLSAQMVQSVPKISFFRASGYLRCLDSGRKYHHSGGQFAIRNDSAILYFRYHRGSRRLLFSTADRHLSAPVADGHLFPDLISDTAVAAFYAESRLDPGMARFYPCHRRDPCGADLSAPDPGICHRWSAARGSQHPQHADDTAQCHRRYRAWRILSQIRLVQQRDDALYGVRHDRQLLDDELRTRLRTQIHARPAPDSDLFPQSLGLHRRNTHCRRLPCL